MTAALAAPLPDRSTITLRAAPRREPPFDDELPRHLHAVGALDQQLPFEVPGLPRIEPVPPSVQAGLPDPAGWSRRLLVGLIESAAGRRPMQQLATLLSHSVAYGLGGDLERCARQGRRHWTHAATVRSVRASEPTEGVAEVCATLQVRDRVRAVALRLEVQSGRWRCTRLQLG